MRRPSIGLLLLTVLLNGIPAWAQQYRSFVACPVVRDTKTSPCFLSEYEGDLYYLGTQSDTDDGARLPQLKHEVLVEGRVEAGPRVCGGIRLSPVAISIMKEVNLACSTMLPPEPGIEAPALPRANAARKSPSPSATGKQEFSLLYGFDDDSLSSPSTDLLNDIAAYAKRIDASAIEVIGFQGSSRLSNGNLLTEKPGLAAERARSIAILLRGLGAQNVLGGSKDEPEPGDGQSDASRRRVMITVVP